MDIRLRPKRGRGYCAGFVQRISVVGTSGSGKSTLAAALAGLLRVPHLELDGVFHQAGWEPLPLAEFRERVADFAAGEAWVVDGNYSAVRDLVWERADTVAWLDLPRVVVMRRLAGRTVRRVLTRRTLWNGNQEPLRSLLPVGPEESILAWAWVSHAQNREKFLAAASDPANAHLTFVRLRSPRDVRRFLRQCQDGR